VAKFEGVDNAAEIRDLIVERLRVYRDSGLGEETVEAQESLALSTAHEVLQETRVLRRSIASLHFSQACITPLAFEDKRSPP
jgi:hypothetical protein